MDFRDYREVLEQRGNPLLEGEQATFFWLGEEAPDLIGDFTNWEYGQPAEMEERAPGVWAAECTFEADAYIEYVFWDGEQRFTDPYNPHSISNGIGGQNHYFYMPDGGPTPLAASSGGFPRGLVARYDLPTEHFLAGKTRAVYLYQPPTSQPCPLWVVWDGRDYLRRAHLVTLVDNLIGAKRIPALALALVHHGGPYRFMEYACSEASLGWLEQILLPFASRNLNLLDPGKQPGAYGVMGASMGGLMALYTGMRRPEIFGRVLSQSGAFQMDETMPVVQDLVRCGPRQPLRIWMDAGKYEWLLEPNRRMAALLQERGYAASYREYPGGHNYTAWRDDAWRGIEALAG